MVCTINNAHVQGNNGVFKILVHYFSQEAKAEYNLNSNLAIYFAMKHETINDKLVCNCLFVHQGFGATVLLSITASFLVTFSVSRCTTHVPVRGVQEIPEE